MSPDPGGTGTLAQEAALLLDAVAHRLTAVKPDPDAAPPERCPECGAVPGASCTACPLCRFIAVLKGERPDAAARMVDGALLIVRGLRSLLPDVDGGGPPPGPPPGSGDHAPAPPPTARPGGLERIDIR